MQAISILSQVRLDFLCRSLLQRTLLKLSASFTVISASADNIHLHAVGCFRSVVLTLFYASQVGTHQPRLGLQIAGQQYQMGDFIVRVGLHARACPASCGRPAHHPTMSAASCRHVHCFLQAWHGIAASDPSSCA